MSDPFALSPVAAADLKPMLPPASTALVIIDVQNDFVAQDGVLGRAGLDMTPLQPALDRIKSLIAKAREVELPIVLVRVVTREKSDSQAMKLLMQRRGYPDDALELCRAGEWGADYHPTIQPQDGDIHIEKLLYSSFSGTDLNLQLRARGIDTLVIAGFTTDCCVDSTARDAFHHQFNVFVVDDACAAYDERVHRAAMGVMAMHFALPVRTEDVIAVWT
ncbi:cysteine hydrolase family protein [Brevundimonas sp. SORGH_AS_0993]|uniref:cysteine hydrolase family protein n=1 Tax=Brevundimonas sp. SORGH_AS_0993 TaxID=3041794 RepID=UPI00277E9D0D|nr:isochorismatase family cysteine hydrolase [Brevundimonas sp. SORGH_AS_0993]MDQ1153648.1 nicotinamidase-related amidase [Brevundimonas sp. SORGH_AS_0993]